MSARAPQYRRRQRSSSIRSDALELYLERCVGHILGPEALVGEVGVASASLWGAQISSDDTGDAMSVIQFTIPEGSGPPPHVHNCVELVYVIEGNARFHADGETFEAGPGAVLHFPEGTEETFEPIGQVKLLTAYTPGRRRAAGEGGGD